MKHVLDGGAAGSNRERSARRPVKIGYRDAVRRSPSVSIALFGAGLALAGCNVYDASLLVPGDAGAAGDAASDAPVDVSVDAATDGDAAPPTGGGVGFWSGPGDQGCFSAGRPATSERPTTPGGTPLPDIYLAIDTLRLGALDRDGGADKNAWKTLGFDLDGKCSGSATCSGVTNVACVGPDGGALAVDGDDCRDNMFGRLAGVAISVPQVGARYGLSEDAFNCSLCAGSFTFVIKVSGYDGTEDDDDLRVDLYPSPGLETPLPLDCSSPGWSRDACFLPAMPWKIATEGMAAPSAGPALPDAKLADAHAYVKAGYLVMQLPDDALFWFPTQPGAAINAFPAKLQKGVVSGRIVKGADQTWGVEDGIVAGRLKATDVLEGFQRIGLCPNDSNFHLIDIYLSQNLDITAGDADPSTACDALSMGVGFTARQAVAGALESAPLPGACVGDAGAEGGDGG